MYNHAMIYDVAFDSLLKTVSKETPERNWAKAARLTEDQWLEIVQMENLRLQEAQDEEKRYGNI